MAKSYKVMCINEKINMKSNILPYLPKMLYLNGIHRETKEKRFEYPVQNSHKYLYPCLGK